LNAPSGLLCLPRSDAGVGAVTAKSLAESSRSHRYRIRGFTVDVDRWQLRDAQGAVVEIAPLAFRLLVYLIEHRDRVVPKGELFEALWGGVSVADGSLTQAIWTMRRALGEDAGSPRIVQSVRGRGYSLLAPVELLGEATAPAAVPAASSAGEHVIESGRSAELARLEQAIDAASRGQGRAVLISGGAGIGKTWLADEVAMRAATHGTLCCEGRAYETQGTPPMWALRQLAVAIASALPDVAATLTAEHARDLRTLAPELELQVAESDKLPLRTPSEQRFFVWNALLRLLERASERRPLLLVLEDLHWADEATLLFLERLAGELHRMRVLALCTFRQTAEAALRRVVTALSRDSGTLLLPLAGLPAQSVRALLHENGVPAPSDALVERALAVTSGNPLFVTQLARWLVLDEGAASASPDAVELPAESRAVLRQQIDGLPAASRDALHVAAALGDDFHLGELQAALGIKGEELLERLAAAETARLLARDDEHPLMCRFGHPSMRTAIYEDVAAPERARLHQRIADALVRGSSGGGLRLNAIAHHYYEAAPLGCVEQAVRFGLLAAQSSYRATAYEDAITHCRRVLGVLPLAQVADPRAYHEAQLLLGHALRLVGANVEAVRDAYAKAADAAGEAFPELHAHAAMSFAGRGPTGLGLLRAAGTVEPRELMLLDRSLLLLPADDSATRALAEGWLAHANYNTTQRERRVELATRSVAMARRVGDPAALVECLMLSQLSIRGPDALPARLETLREAAKLAASVGLLAQQLDATEELAWSSFEAGNVAEAEVQMLEVVRLAEEAGRPHDRRKEARFRVMRLDADGRFAEAEALIADGRGQSTWPPEHLDQGNAIRDFMVQYLRGRCGAIIAPLEAMAKQFPLPVGWHCGLASSYATIGRLDDARRELERLSADDFAVIPDDHNRISSYAMLASAAQRLEHRAAAAVLRRKLEPYAERNILSGIHGYYYGPVWRTLAMLDLTLGEHELGLSRIERAIARERELGSRVGEAWSRLVGAELHAARGGRGGCSRAAEQLEVARRLAHDPSLRFLHDWSARLSRGLRTSSSHPLD